jgi:long-chain acyl-CoA synthetase
MAKNKLILDYVYDLEASQPDKVYLTQPLGQGKVADYTWKQTLDQSRRMAAYLKSRNFEPGARIAILSKNCAHFFIAELAIWLAGYTTVAIFPTEGARNHELRARAQRRPPAVRRQARHLGAAGAGRAVPTCRCIALPLAPRTDCEHLGFDIAWRGPNPWAGRPARAPDDHRDDHLHLGLHRYSPRAQ